ncbi:endoribonuclease [Thiohalorhabdus denitrificans]|uniref:Endoribonuclease L-PSP n=1 Tax=Thiohalorhabdus denitrificans TaxID=381306 RepID=A0A0P9GGF3_9GAMM|nr:RidA family protein [Thiohalorhabdus denitrificans]KPV39098.1 endoribonuclease [Thiohalorhabdus denitrificans]SCX77739.1 endoribonuclease L-PSP [Thiohalorhabdus denitrificans]
MYFRENYHTDAAPQAIGPYSQAVRAGELVFISGQIPLDPVTMELVEGDFRRQVEQVLTNIEAVASAAGGTLCQVVKLTVYLTDLAKFEVVNEVLDDYFLEPYPARAALGVAALPKGAEVEMEAIMHVEPGEAE